MSDLRPADALAMSSLVSQNGHVHQREPLEADHLSQLGNAHRFARKHGADVRFTRAFGWFYWDGTRWAVDDTGEIERRGKDVVRDLHIEAGYELADDRRKALSKHALSSETAAEIRAMLDLARSELGIAATAADFDRDAWLLNCANGTIDLRTFELRPHDPAALITRVIPVAYDATAICPTFEAFLRRILPSDAVRDFVQRWCGYCLTGAVSEQCMAFFQGGGSNGKSTLVNAVANVMNEYASYVPSDVFLKQRNGEAALREMARLRGARLAVCIEPDAGKGLAESLLKSATGGDPIVGRHLFRESFAYRPEFKIVLLANHRPRITGTDHAIWRRVRLIPFVVTIADHEQDKDLPAKLRAEMPGILAWLVAGCRKWCDEGLGAVPAEVRQATAAYRAEMDPLGDFVKDVCIVTPDAHSTSDGLYTAYIAWCSKEHETPMPQRAFASALKERGFEQRRSSKARGWRGIAVRGPDDDPAEPDASEQEDTPGDEPEWVQGTLSDG